MTVIVVAHDAMHAARLEAALRDLAGWRIRVGTPATLRRIFEEHPAAILVIVGGGSDARRVLHALRAWPRSPAIVALSDDPARLWTSAARALGLRAALPLAATPEQLVEAVRAVHAGLFVLHADALAPAPARGAPTATGAPLTTREREILEMMADGASNRVIATRLAISRHTVKFHVAAVLAKLGATSRTEAVAVALRRGLLSV